MFLQGMFMFVVWSVGVLLVRREGWALRQTTPPPPPPPPPLLQLLHHPSSLQNLYEFRFACRTDAAALASLFLQGSFGHISPAYVGWWSSWLWALRGLREDVDIKMKAIPKPKLLALSGLVMSMTQSPTPKMLMKRQPHHASPFLFPKPTHER
ncbi:hypothetical protein IWX47DRAFT_852594 [Phyllosticta citricarpa]